MTSLHSSFPRDEARGAWSGRTLAGRYELGQLLGTGGMAEVYAAIDRRLGRSVAVKVLRPELARDEKIRSRFRREARSAASLNHPSVVAVHDTADDSSEPFIIMEHVTGPTLRDIMQRGQPTPLDHALGITIGVLTALEFAHRAGIVHRDIKPCNIMITPDGIVKVMDFGIARVLDDDATITQTVVGTPAYLSPEHAEGIPVDERSDLYSTGCVLFELLTGRPPFVAESAYVVAVQHIQNAPPVPSTLNPTLPLELDHILAKALEKDRDARFQTAEQFRAALVAVSAGATADRASSVPLGQQKAATEPIVLTATTRMPPSPQPSRPTGAALLENGPFPQPVASESVLPSPTATGLASPGSPNPDRPGTYGQRAAAPGRSARRRWLWAAAAALLVFGGATFALIRSDGGPGTAPESKLWEVFDPASVGSPPKADLMNSVTTIDKTGAVTVVDKHDKVRVLNPAETIKQWKQPDEQ